MAVHDLAVHDRDSVLVAATHGRGFWALEIDAVRALDGEALASESHLFPVGDVDPRLPVHEDIIGVITASGKPVAFQRSKAFVALKQGDEIAFENVRLELEAGGIKAVGDDGSDLGSHQAFWFAWSQFYPQTELWPG